MTDISSVADTLPLLFFVGLFIFFAKFGFSKNRRNFFVKTAWKGEIIEDYGIISTEVIHGLLSVNITQQIRLLKIRDNKETFFVFEVKDKSWGSISYRYVKVSETVVKLLVKKL